VKYNGSEVEAEWGSESYFYFCFGFPDLQNGNNTVKGTLEWTGEQQYFKTGDYYSALGLEVKCVLK